MKKIKIIGPIQYYESQPLGSGSSGSVFKGKLRNSNFHSSSMKFQQIQLAVKVIPHHSRHENQVTRYLFQCEKQALTKLLHPHIIKCYGVFQDGRNSYLATQYINGGTLKQYMNQRNKINESQAISILRKLLQGLHYISSKGFVHRDLKPANVMIRQVVDRETGLKTLLPIIIDFGFSERINCNYKPQMFYNVGSPSYMAPQSYNFTKYSQKSDVWSLGVVFYEILTRQCIDQNIRIQQFFNFTADAVEKKLSKNQIYLSMKCYKILKHILVSNQSQRPRIVQLIHKMQKLQYQHQLNKRDQINKRDQTNKKAQELIKLEALSKYEQAQKNQANKQTSFSELRNIKSRQKLRIPLFLDNNKRIDRMVSIQKTLGHRSPANLANLIQQKQVFMIQKVKIQQFINIKKQVYNVSHPIFSTNSQRIVQLERNVGTSRNTPAISFSLTDKFNSSRQRNFASFMRNPEKKVFDKLYFNYKTHADSFQQHILYPSHHHIQKNLKFVVSARN